MKSKSRYLISDKNHCPVFVGNREECMRFMGYSDVSRVSQVASRQKIKHQIAKRYYIELLRGGEND